MSDDPASPGPPATAPRRRRAPRRAALARPLPHGADPASEPESRSACSHQLSAVSHQRAQKASSSRDSRRTLIAESYRPTGSLTRSSAVLRTLRVTVCDARGRPVRAPGLSAWLSRVVGRAAKGEATVALVSDAAMRRINRDYRRVDRVTDVLSFPTDDTPRAGQARARLRPRTEPTGQDPSPGSRVPNPQSPGPRPQAPGPSPQFLGAIVIARGRAAAQAREAGHALATELRVLALHGLLHLLGYDHESDNGEMARTERRLRRRGGLGAGLIEREVSR